MGREFFWIPTGSLVLTFCINSTRGLLFFIFDGEDLTRFIEATFGRIYWNWCLLFVLIRHGFRGGSGPQL